MLRYLQRRVLFRLIFLVAVILFSLQLASWNTDIAKLPLDSKSTSSELSTIPVTEQMSIPHTVWTSLPLQKSVPCKLPELQPLNPEVKKFIQPASAIHCNRESSWIYIFKQKIYIASDAVKKYGKISCKYKDFSYKTDWELSEQNYVTTENGTSAIGDFLEAKCTSTSGKNFSNIYMTVVPKDTASEKNKNIESRIPQLSVYMFAIDSTSRMNAMRKLPKSYEFLTKTLNAIVLQGYNIVGDGTPQALIPIFTGKTEEELPLTRKRFANANFVDVYPWIWNSFKNASYVTFYAEDAWSVGTFQYRLKGFKKKPVDHFGRPFFSKVQGSCVGGKAIHQVMNGYSEHLFQNYPKDKKKFAFLFHGVLSHGDLNAVGAADDDFLAHLQFFKNSGHLDNTILIFMADHGARFAKLRATQQGQLEERLPMFSIFAPQWFRKQHSQAWANLQKNSKRLTTPFDIHETLKVILNWREPRIGDVRSRGISLFDEVPIKRTCQQAGIDPHWCVCLNWEKIPAQDATGLQVVHAVVDRINNETDRERGLCAPLNLDKIDSIKRLAPNEKLMKYKNVKDIDGFVPDFSGKTEITSAIYQVTFWTKPGAAHYEATAEWKQKFVPVNLNTVSIINRYGDKPHCVIDKDYFLAKWCVCYDKIK